MGRVRDIPFVVLLGQEIREEPFEFVKAGIVRTNHFSLKYIYSYLSLYLIGKWNCISLSNARALDG